MVHAVIFNLKLKIKNSSKGITLIEVVVIVFIIALFATILISDFPKMQREFALSRAAHKLAQDLRRTQDMALSGLQVKNSRGDAVGNVKGFGVYINLGAQPPEQYIIYADIAPPDSADASQSFDNLNAKSCEQYDSAEDTGDCIVETIDVSQQNPYLYIKGINGIDSNNTSINFSPPDPKVNIENLAYSQSQIGIKLGLTTDPDTRIVQVNTSGLINIE